MGSGKTWMQKLAGLFQPSKVSETDDAQSEAVIENPCCSNIVHIAYRGVSDDRMYMAYSRKWAEVRFFRPLGLRVFCAQCRRRVL